MKIATWNVNSIRVRQNKLLAWLEKHDPDVICLQETKVVDKDFPKKDLEAQGYNASIWGQKSYNGVAILSKEPAHDIEIGFNDGADDRQARVIAATCGGVRVICVYVPNGGRIESENYFFKLEWLARLHAYLGRCAKPDQMVLLCGDFNVAPMDLDVHNPALWKDDVLCSEAERSALRRVVDWGFVDAYRSLHDESGFSWWDYRKMGFEKDRGLRIDHIYLSKPLAKHLIASKVDREERSGKQPSDHAPVFVEFDLK